MINFLKKLFNKKGKEYIKTITIQPTSTKLELEKLTPQEIDYIKLNIEIADRILMDLGLNQEEHIFEPARIEQAISTWFQDDLQTKFGMDVNKYSNSLAAGWGKYLEEKLGMTWHVITDEFGTEIGLYHTQNQVTLFPFNLTAKAFNKKDFALLSIITNKTQKVISNKL